MGRPFQFMPELPWYKRFPQDWMSDPKLGRCSPAARGIWADIIENCYLANAPEICGSTPELARVCRCSEQEFVDAVKELKKHEVGVFMEAKGQQTIGCRRLYREHKIKELRRKAGVISGTKRHQTPQHPSASVSVSACTGNGSAGGRGAYHPESRIALHWLNERAGVHFRELDVNLSIISDRLFEDGVTLQGVKEMIERQVKTWTGTRQQDFLRPTTLFEKAKFDAYYANRDHPVNNVIKTQLRPNELRTVIEAKESQCSELKRKHCSEAALGDSWSSQDARAQFFTIKKEIKTLRTQLASFT